MKKIIIAIAILFSLKSGAQVNTRLDTVFARYRVFTYEELNWIKGTWTPRDSLEKVFFRKVQAVVKAVPNKTDATNITVDSIPGPISVLWYSNFRNATEGETAGLTNNIKNQIKNYTPLNGTCVSIDTSGDDKRKNTTKNGRQDW